MLEDLNKDGAVFIESEKAHINDVYIKKFMDKRHLLINYINNLPYDVIRIATLGPNSTTSCYAAELFINYLKRIVPTKSFELELDTPFQKVYDSLIYKKTHLIVAPNAHQDIADMYWNTDIVNLFCFLEPTPKYGIATNKNIKDISPLKIASCRAVYCLIETLGAELLTGKEYILVDAYSTNDAVKLVINNEADIAVTNESSIVDTNFNFISPLHYSEVLWTVFGNKNIC